MTNPTPTPDFDQLITNILGVYVIDRIAADEWDTTPNERLHKRLVTALQKAYQLGRQSVDCGTTEEGAE